MLRLAFALVCGLAPAIAVADPAPETDFELAKAHFKTGEIYYERGRFADAAREFEEAYRLSNRAELLYNMGKSYDGAGDPARALAAYRRFLAAVSRSPDLPAVEARVVALVRVVGQLAVRSSVDGAQVRVDGNTVGTTPLPREIELNPGPHAIELSREGYATWRGSVTIKSAARDTLQADPQSLVKVIRVEVPEKKGPPVYKRWWFWTALGVAVAVAGGVTAGVLATRDEGVPQPSAQLPAVR
jgi:tetratricopeptide (TPR) repeat protein